MVHIQKGKHVYDSWIHLVKPASAVAPRFFEYQPTGMRSSAQLQQMLWSLIIVEQLIS